MTRWVTFLAVTFVCVLLSAAERDATSQEQVVAKAVGFLKTAQADDGSFSGKAGIGPTGLVAAALLKNGRTPSDPMVAKALAVLEKNVRADGGIYSEGSKHGNYETCIAIMALSEANKDGKYDKQLKGADKYLKHLQWGEKDGLDESADAYGGGGYGSHNRPDMSNTTFLIDALKSTGNGPDSQAMQRALIFVSRCQNLESEFNTTEHAAKINDGGFYYTVAAGGQSSAGSTDNGGLRSYGAMTYAGLKSMLTAGVSPDDKRVKAAMNWLKQHYTFEENPNMGQAGLYYYYHTLAKSLAAVGDEKFTDADGKQHDWQAELVAALAKRQQADGSWVNEAPRWMEGDANLVTAYALLALSYCKQP